jgi:hypothetical protein
MNNFELEKKIKRFISELSNQKGFICSIDVLLGLEYLSKADYDRWRNGQVEYLEKICKTNLNKLTMINQVIRQECGKMNWTPSLTVYNKFGKGPKRKLRFSKFGNLNIENAYSTHFLNKYQIAKLKENKNTAEDNHQQSLLQ